MLTIEVNVCYGQHRLHVGHVQAISVSSCSVIKRIVTV